MEVTSEDFRQLRERVVYNQTDMGELGGFVRTDYVLNFITQLEKAAKKQ